MSQFSPRVRFAPIQVAGLFRFVLLRRQFSTRRDAQRKITFGLSRNTAIACRATSRHVAQYKTLVRHGAQNHFSFIFRRWLKWLKLRAFSFDFPPFEVGSFNLIILIFMRPNPYECVQLWSWSCETFLWWKEKIKHKKCCESSESFRKRTFRRIESQKFCVKQKHT